MTTAQHIFKGNGAPTDVPQSLAAHYIDEDTGDQYLSTGTTNATDWRLAVQVSEGKLAAQNPGTYLIKQTTRTVEADISEGSVTLELEPALLIGSTSFEVLLYLNSSPATLSIRGTASGPGASLGYAKLDSMPYSDHLAGAGQEWRLSSEGANVWFVWFQVMVNGGAIYLLERMANVSDPEE
ncbi:hypothetical protein VUJ49_22675 [Pseudomonas berkeleyensis]|uniref:Uncharacterized protein n=1 Tax=Pseudomonas berkeleyensis TaxID=2726956 RepID=A0A7G5DM02_9PSED|nr:hypothetical protein [Pseudomonas berkeleyensis]QMV62777.1 hypothetical protein HS968_22580 [Pseudomonas berkeleyensis]WSO38227.1 hypothetical protein VUJ49_22675 [Pseudomonas berkeleyensis]